MSSQLSPAGGVSVLRTQIMDAIEALRLRKSKPDRETIAHYVLKKHSEEGFDFAQIFTELENTVDDGQLLKVEYKGTTSYRHPSSFDQKSSPLLTKHSKILNSTRTTRLIISTVTELFDAWRDTGIPLAVLKDKLITDVDPTRFTSEKIDLILDREFFMSNNTIVLVDKDKKQIPTPKGNLSASATAPAESYVWWSKDLKAENTAAAAAAEEKTSVSSSPNMSTRRSKRKNSDEDKELENKNDDGESESKIVKLVDNDTVQELDEDNSDKVGNNGTEHDDKNVGENHHNNKKESVENAGKETEDDEDNYDEIEEILQKTKKSTTKKATKSNNKKNDTLSTPKVSESKTKVGKQKNSSINDITPRTSEFNIEKLTKQIIVDKKFKVEKNFDDAVKKISDNLRKKSAALDKSPPPSKSISPKSSTSTNSPIKSPTISPSSSSITPKQQQQPQTQQPYRISSRTKRKREVFDPSDYHSKSAQSESTTTPIQTNQVSQPIPISNSTPKTSKSKPVVVVRPPSTSPSSKSKPKPSKDKLKLDTPLLPKTKRSKKQQQQSEDISEKEVKKEAEADEENIQIGDSKNDEDKTKSSLKQEPSDLIVEQEQEQSVKVEKDVPVKKTKVKVKEKDLQNLKEKIINISKTKKKASPKKKRKLSPKSKSVISQVEDEVEKAENEIEKAEEIESVLEDKKEETEDLEVKEKEKVVKEPPKELEEGEILPENLEQIIFEELKDKVTNSTEDHVGIKANIELIDNGKESESTITTTTTAEDSQASSIDNISSTTDAGTDNDKNVPIKIVIPPKKSKRGRKLVEDISTPQSPLKISKKSSSTDDIKESIAATVSKISPSTSPLKEITYEISEEIPTKSVIKMDVDDVVVNEELSIKVDDSSDNQENEKKQMDVEQDQVKVEVLVSEGKDKSNDIQVQGEENLKLEQPAAEVLKNEDEENRNQESGILNECTLDINQVQEWSSANVQEYFKSKGLAEEGQILRDEEIDGLALLLLSREDVLYGLKFKIGPALKIYRVVHNLQNDTPTLDISKIKP